ncbi:MAG: ferrous iron transport protein A, partial [Flavobacteriales bacterium]
PIPDKYGNFADLSFVKLSKLNTGDKGTITGVSEHSSAFLKHLEKLGLTLGKKIELVEVVDFDGSVEILCEGNKLNISREVAKHLLISKTK